MMPAKDLSTIHHLITNLFQWPHSPGDWDQFRLSKEQVDRFHDQGFLGPVKMIDENSCCN